LGPLRTFVLRVTLILGWTACGMAFFWVSFDREGGEIVRTRVGLPPSPWLCLDTHHGTVSWEVHVVSLSAVLCLVAVGCFVGDWQVSRRGR
jgi:hypothetical protein